LSDVEQASYWKGWLLGCGGGRKLNPFAIATVAAIIDPLHDTSTPEEA
jgi:hypothetical protein